MTYSAHYHVRGGGGGAHLDNIFPDFFPFKYKLFLIIEIDGKTAKAIGEKQVFDTVPMIIDSKLTVLTLLLPGLATWQWWFSVFLSEFFGYFLGFLVFFMRKFIIQERETQKFNKQT